MEVLAFDIHKQVVYRTCLQGAFCFALRAAPRQPSSRVLHLLPSGRQDLHFPLIRATVAASVGSIGSDTLPQRVASAANARPSVSLLSFAVFGGVGAVRASEKDLA